MDFRAVALLAASSLLSLQGFSAPARAENQMGYQMLSTEQSAALARNGGELGMDVGQGEQITSGGLNFELLRVGSLKPNSPASRAGLNVGDQVISVDGRVFPSVAAFARYVASIPPTRQISVDYIAKGGGRQQAQRVVMLVGGVGARSQSDNIVAASKGLSPSSRTAIGVGAVALFGCYEVGCFARSALQPPLPPVRPQ